MIPARAFFDLVLGEPLDVYDEKTHETNKRLEALGWSHEDEILHRIMMGGLFVSVPIVAILTVGVGWVLGLQRLELGVGALLFWMGFWLLLPLWSREFRLRVAEGRYLRRREDGLESVGQPDRGWRFPVESRPRDVDDLGRSGGVDR